MEIPTGSEKICREMENMNRIYHCNQMVRSIGLVDTVTSHGWVQYYERNVLEDNTIYILNIIYKPVGTSSSKINSTYLIHPILQAKPSLGKQTCGSTPFSAPIKSDLF